jgi:hypothetical protein
VGSRGDQQEDTSGANHVPFWPLEGKAIIGGMSHGCVPPDTAAEYRHQAEKIRILAEQVSLLGAKFHLFEAAQHLEELAAGEDRR